METVGFLSLLVFALVAQAVYLLVPDQNAPSAIVQRLTAYNLPRWESSVATQISVLRRKQYSRIRWLDAVLQRIDVGDKLAGELRRAGLPMRAGEFIFIMLATATLAAFAAAIALGATASGLLVSGSAAIVGFLAPLVWLRWKRLKRLSTFEHTLPDAVDLIAGSLRAGYGISQGLDLVGREFPGPCGEEFGQVLQEINLGSDLDVALARLVDRIESEDARLLATAVAVQRRTGGNLIEVLQQMARVIRERLRLRGEVRVITTAPRVSGYVVGLLPVVTVAFMLLTSPYYAKVLFNEPIGHAAMAIGGVLVLVGVYLNHKIAQVDM